MKPRTKGSKADQFSEPLSGELATYEKVGLFQRAVNPSTAYRYRGALLRYQQAIAGAPPTLDSSRTFLGHLREQGFTPSTLRVYRAALQGFHLWRGENLEFTVKVPHHAPSYIEASIVSEVLAKAREIPLDYLVLHLLANAGLRREEAVNLRVRNVGTTALRFRGKGDKDRTVPLTQELARILAEFCHGKEPDDAVLGVGEGVIYRIVKKYGRIIGKPELKPHDFRHAFATRLTERGVNLRVVQELLGHTNLNTTQVYTGVSGQHLEEGIAVLNPAATRPPVPNSNDGASQATRAAASSLSRHTALMKSTFSPILPNLLKTMAYLPCKLNIKGPVVEIERVQLRCSDPGVPFQIMVFERNPPEDLNSWEGEDILQMGRVQQRHFTYAPGYPLEYINETKDPSILLGIAVGARPLRFDLPFNEGSQEWLAHYRAPVELEIKINYLIR